MRERLTLSEKNEGEKLHKKAYKKAQGDFFQSGSENRGSTECQNNSVEFLMLSSLTCPLNSTVINLLLQNVAECL